MALVGLDVHQAQTVAAVLDPGTGELRVQWLRGEPASVVPVFLEDLDDGLLSVVCDEEPVMGSLDRRLALGILDAELRMYIALNAPEHVFVHAGVVGVGERAIVLPGRSFAGKTTLVAALVRAGAEYWSDEYAVLDADGLVHQT
jgi:hypothetical protein